MTGRKISGVIIAIVCLVGISAVIAQSPPRSPLKPWLSKALTELSTRVGTNEVKVVSKRVTLSYIDPDRAGQMLGLHGFTVGKLEEKVNQAGLPVVVPLPGTPSHESIPKAGEKFPLTETDPIGELIVFYDENQPVQISSVIATLREHIDVPARQIIIEAMILEISSTALEEMGVKWSRASGARDSGNFVNSHLSELSIGSLKHPHPAADAALALTTKGIFHDLNAEIKALVRDGQAEVLSRPSVLALNNRMAYISVAEDIPVAKSSYAKSDYQTTSFAKEKAGITLALRPRIDATGEEVSMQVNAEVTAKVPDADLEVRDKSNVLLASMPTISRREVRTYVRVANNTPFIIGGLIAKDKQSTVDKVPILGDIPLLGALFRSKKETAVKREVIIVLTPFVLPEEYVSGKYMPKDEDAFDSVDNQLFRDAYRIRAEDTFDLNYLTQNHQLRSMKALATRIIAGDIGLAEQYPYNRFVGSAIPGEDILCHRQIYEVLKRQKTALKLDANKLIFFKPDRNIQSGFRVQFLQQYLAANAPHILTAKGGKTALAITFVLQRSSDAAHSILKEPVPAVQLVDCPDEDTWSRLLWDLNKPDPESKPSFTVLMRNSRDIERLKYAVLMKKTVELNTKSQVLQLSNFTRGRLLLMPTVKPKDVELIDGDVARSFFYSEQYYQALQNIMEQDISAFRRVIEEKDHLKKLINPRRP